MDTYHNKFIGVVRMATVYFASCHRIIIEVRYEAKDMGTYYYSVDHVM